MVIGTAGGGKSTLIRTILRDLLFNQKNEKYSIVSLLSEETCQQYKTQLVHGLEPDKRLENCVLMSEIDEIEQGSKYFFDNIEMLSPDVLIYDNLTTSRFYEGARPSEQVRYFSRIKELTSKINCATIIVAHTAANVSDNQDKLIEPNDIRGNKTVVNMAEFFYVMQRFQDEKGAFFPTITVKKHRGQELVHAMYLLQYEKRLRSFIGDHALEFTKFKEYFKMRRRL
jgi:GTPase SAR1 family protein